MRSTALKIEAITAVAGNVPLELTLPNALRMVEIAGCLHLPVAAGAKAPLVRQLVTAVYAHGENGLGGAVFPEPKIKPVAEPASEFIRQIVRQYPGEVTLLPIRPADQYRYHPEDRLRTCHHGERYRKRWADPSREATSRLRPSSPFMSPRRQHA